jgi:hypothetical protein
VGDDLQLLLWDTGSPGAPAARVREAHGSADLHCVDWSPLQPELLVTGARAAPAHRVHFLHSAASVSCAHR